MPKINQPINQDKKEINRWKTGCNLDALVSEYLLHPIIFKFDQNIIPKLDQHIKKLDKNGWTIEKLNAILMQL